MIITLRTKVFFFKTGNRTVNYLSLDIEGAELQVGTGILSTRLSEWRSVLWTRLQVPLDECRYCPFGKLADLQTRKVRRLDELLTYTVLLVILSSSPSED